MPHIERSKF